MPQARDEAGNIWETDAQGNALRLVSHAGGQQSQGSVFSLPPSPQQVRTNERQDRNDNRTASNEAARIALAQAEEARKQREFAGTHNPDGSPKTAPNDGAGSAKIRADAIAQWNAAAQIDRILNDMRGAYAKGPGGTKGISGLKDFFPSPANQTFDDAANQSRGIVRNALGLTGGEANTAAEANMNLGGYLPQSTDWDERIVNKFQNLEGVRDNARRQAIQTLGGIPDANGNITPLPAQNAPNAMTQTYVMPGDPMSAAPAGATTHQVPVPAGMQSEYNAYIAAHASNLDPNDFVRFRLGLDQKYGYPSDPAKTEEYRGFAERTAQKGRTGGTIQTRIPGTTQPMSQLDQNQNSLVNNPVGAAVVGAADAGGFGIPSLLARDKMGALGDQHGLAMGLGQIAGSIGATSGLAKAGASTIGKLLPKLLQGGGKGAFARNVATDLAYGTVTGTNQGMDPSTAALASTIGSVGGQGVGKAIGGTIGGLALSPAVQALKDKGVRLTTGQLVGGMGKGIEDAMTSLPGIGDMINARRLEGFKDFNRSLFNEAGEPIGATVGGLGEQGVGQLLDPNTGAVPQAYNRATAGARVQLDPQFGADMQAARQAGSGLPMDLAPRFDTALNNRVEPIATAGEMTGDTYQQAFRGLKGYRAETTKPGFEQDYRDALTTAMDALTSQMQRGGGSHVVEGLGKADQAYRGAKTLQRAVQAAKNGSGTGEVQIFTPAQANTASTQAANKFGGGRQFGDTIDAAQTVLPSKLPDSGTGRRIMQGVIGSGLVGGAGGYSATTGDYGSTAKAAALMGLLALGGTRGGQRVIEKLLTGRPVAAKTLGRAIGKKGGLFGSAAVPLMLESGK
jgi:hypothetical protein